MNIREALSIELDKLKRVVSGNSVPLDPGNIINMRGTVGSKIPRSVEQRFYDDAEERMEKRLREFDSKYKPGYHGVVTLPTGQDAVYSRTKNGSMTIGVNLKKISPEEAGQLGLSVYILDQAYQSAAKGEDFSENDLSSLKESQVQEHINWLASRTTRKATRK